MTNLSGHETVVLFPSLGHLEPDGRTWRLHIHGEVYSPGQVGFTKRILLRLLQRAMKAPPHALDSEIFRDRIQRFLANDERGKRIAVRVGDTTCLLARKSGGNGHFSGIVRVSDEALHTWREQGTLCGNRLSLEVCLPRSDVSVQGQIYLLPRQGLSVISDIDDTLKHTGVGSRVALLENTFLREFRSIPGMAERFQAWAEAGAAFHYVSSSPWQLYRHLSDYLSVEGFPEGSFHLRAFRLRDHLLRRLLMLRRSGKGGVIKHILRTFPQRRFILVGDSTEADPEIYAAMARRFPWQIARILIREIDGPKNRPERFARAFRGLPPSLAVTYRDARELPFSVPLVMNGR